jgi:N-acetyl-alpha-D-muramate 1-phosphate uridylyltransferase
LQAVVLAGGLATRMRPRTLTVPKSMLEVAGRPFVEWQLERLAACGLRDVVMCVAHLGEAIRAHVGDGARFGVRARWVDEGPALLGTAGAVRNALPLLERAFLVTYGDSYLPFDYAEPLRVLRATGDCDGVLAVFPNAGRWDASNVVIADGTGGDTGTGLVAGGGPARPPGPWVARYEKGNRDPVFDHIDYGAMALLRETIAALPAGSPAGLDTLQHDLAGRRRLRACVARERFFEIGSPEGLAELDRYLLSRASS